MTLVAVFECYVDGAHYVQWLTDVGVLAYYGGPHNYCSWYPSARSTVQDYLDIGWERVL